MNILLTGSTGFVGQHLKKRLEDEGHNLILYHRQFPLILDLINEEFPRPDVIIHCAGEINHPHRMFESNVVLTQKLLKLAQFGCISKFIHIGSSSEYQASPFPLRESDPCVPTDIYSATKIAATNLCLGYANAYDMDICVARPFSLYGPNDTPRKLIPRLLSGKPMKVYEGVHDFIYIKDFVDGIITLLNASRSKTKGDIVNFGTGISLTNKEVVDIILKDKSHIEILGGAQEGYFSPLSWRADITKAEMKYGWKPKYTFQEGIEQILLHKIFNQYEK